MRKSHVVKLILPRVRPETVQPVVNRYRLFITARGSNAATLSVHDHNQRFPVLEWRGTFARRLLDSDPLPPRALTNGAYDLDKSDIQQLALAAVSIAMNSRMNARPHDNYKAAEVCTRAERNLSVRLKRLCIRIPVFHMRVARLLFQYPGKHLLKEDAVGITELQYPSVDTHRIESLLDDLARWRVIQRIEVDDQHVFYDIDTTPHLHVYRSQTGALDDAPDTGVLRID